MEIEKFAIELENALNDWRKCPKEEYEAVLVATTNKIACAFNVLGGAYGIANMGTNSFELWRHYPDTKDKDENLFPYLPLDDSILKSPPKESILEKLVSYLNTNDRDSGKKHPLEKLYSNWIHNLFQMQRDKQVINDAAAPVLVPEFYRKIEEEPFTYVNSADIVAKLKAWLDIWRYAAVSTNGLKATSERARDRRNKSAYEKTLDKNLIDIIQQGWKKAGENKDSEFFCLPEYFFFIDNTQNDIQSLCSSVTVKEVFDALERKDNVPIENNYRDNSNNYLIKEILLLHDDALFPVIPYLFLNIMDIRKFGHCVVPILHSPKFPIEYTMPKKPGQITNPEPKISTCGIVFLGTVQESGHIEDDIGLIKLFMQFASAPLADTVYYGNYQKSRLKSQAFRDIFDNITHELSNLQSFLTNDFLVKFSTAIPSGSDQFGRLEQNRNQMVRTENWQLIMAPKIYKSVADKFTLWTGKGWFNRVEISTPMPLIDALYKLTEVIASSHVAKTFSSIDVVESSFKRDIDDLFLKQSEALFKKIQSLILCDSRLYWIPLKSEGSDIGFARLFSASLSNALEKTEDLKSLKFDYDKGNISFLMKNHATEPGKKYDGGTEAVIRYLVQVYGGDIDKVIFDYDSECNNWITAFSMPAEFIKWRQES
ncbi:hypothetical protein [Methylomonas fluvii]|uniref:Uncharacterized protein n=1 Tax=Methylomonas fluvii TaxID=1854564 RepID=A0ABR9DJR2_9GAMM|nr:hypothetical protein [Methylomonas fluvii]MBD9363349.1 hypothetical protein [Methylomonas fluvii]